MPKPKTIALITGVSNYTGIVAAVCRKLAQQETDIFSPTGKQRRIFQSASFQKSWILVYAVSFWRSI